MPWLVGIDFRRETPSRPRRRRRRRRVKVPPPLGKKG
jgi:hypothetical protein